jgi:hypothetical protein
MVHHSDKVLHLLPSTPEIAWRIFSGRIRVKARGFLYTSAFLCLLVAGSTITHRILTKVHLRSIGGKMKAKLDALLRHLPHLSPQEFEAYVGRTITGTSLQLVETHLSVCHVCKEEVDIVLQAIRDFESGRSAGERAPDATPTTQSLRWGDSSTLWIDDVAYSLMPVGGTQDRVLVEGLASEALEKMAEEDTRAPGTHLVSIESNGAEVIAPLSKFAIARLAPAAGDSVNPSDGNFIEEVTPTSPSRGVSLTVEIFVDGHGTVFLRQ